jgi:RHS repeat-associated protein
VKEFFPQGFQVLRETADIRAGGYYYGRDHLGSIRNLTDRDGRKQAQFDYGPYGEILDSAGDRDPGLPAVRQGVGDNDLCFPEGTQSDFGYTGLFYHHRSGLNFALNRAYDPAFKRWLSRDPIGEHGGINPYVYVRNSPIFLIDPSGLLCQGNNEINDLEVGPGIGDFTSDPIGVASQALGSVLGPSENDLEAAASEDLGGELGGSGDPNGAASENLGRELGGSGDPNGAASEDLGGVPGGSGDF